MILRKNMIIDDDCSCTSRWGQETKCNLYYKCCSKAWLLHLFVAWGYYGGKIPANRLLHICACLAGGSFNNLCYITDFFDNFSYLELFTGFLNYHLIQWFSSWVLTDLHHEVRRFIIIPCACSDWTNINSRNLTLLARYADSLRTPSFTFSGL